MRKLVLMLVLGLATTLSYATSMGPKGDKGNQGEKGSRGEEGDRGATGPTGTTGAIGATGRDGTDGIGTNELYKKKYTGKLSLRLYDNKLFELGIYDTYDFRARRDHEIGAYLCIKIGKSYEERRIDELEDLLRRHLEGVRLNFDRSELLHK